MKIFKNKKLKRILCIYLALNLFFEVVSPTVAFALTSGPTQEEFASFEPASTSDMVDLYSGDFNYNIPLLSIPGPNGGYPINLAYHSGVGMEQEASWVGLGWSLNMGAINRQLRGLPDDFSGAEQIKKTQRVRDTWTAALDIPIGKYRTVAGFPVGTSPYSNTIQVYYNNYKGMGYKYSFGARFPSGGGAINASVGLNLSFDSQQGLDIDPSVSLSLTHKNKGVGFEAGVSYNSRQGITSFNFSDHIIRGKSSEKKIGSNNELSKDDYNGLSETDKKEVSEKDGKYYANVSRSGNTPVPSSHSSFSSSFNVPRTNLQMKTTTVPFTLKLGFTYSVLPLGFIAKFPGYFSGFYTTTGVKSSGNSSYKAYGYLYDKQKGNDATVMSDFTRDDIPYSKKVPNLPMSNFTYDLFNQTGQGSGGMFRAYQNGMSILNDPEVSSDETTVNFDGELGIESNKILISPPFLVNTHVALDGKVGTGNSRCGYWKKIGGTEDYPESQFDELRNSRAPSPDYEDSYMQMYGEKTSYYLGSSDDQLKGLSGDDAVKVKLKKQKHDGSFVNRHYEMDAGNLLVHNESETSGIALGTSNAYKKPGGGRVKRASNIEYISYNDRKKFSYTYRDANITSSYSYNNRVTGSLNQIVAPISGLKQISEMSVLQPDGMRYVYGMPVRNSVQKDYVFSVSSPADQINTTSVPAVLSSNSDLYESKNEYPSYVNSWLLSYVYSPDYVDLTNDGPTTDDLGYWIKFNYGKYFDDTPGNSYKWRMPYSDANYMTGNIGETLDDKGSYSYGEKEMFYIESVETKTHIAIFTLANRHDGIQAQDEANGGLSSNPKKLQKLTKIALYSKNDYYTPTHTVNPNATAVKTTNFEYNYDLCPNVENNDGISEPVSYRNEEGVNVNRNVNASKGKLTLYKVYFTYQKSTRGALSPYFFNYGSTNNTSGAPVYTYDQNPFYSKMNMDRWGNFNNNIDPSSSGAGNYSSSSNHYPYNQFPYTPQDSMYYKNCKPIIFNDDPCATVTSTTKLSPAQWTLKKIFLPTGGVLRINYDFDDYGYVENKRALRMYDICEVTQGTAAVPLSLSNISCRGGAPSPKAIDNQNTSNKVYLYFRLDKPIEVSPTTPLNDDPIGQDATFKKQYLDNLPSDQVFYKVLVHYHQFKSGHEHDDFLSGYGEINRNDYGLVGPTVTLGPNKYKEYGYITLKQVPLAKNNTSGLLVSSMYRSAIENLHAGHPEWIYDQSTVSNTPPTASTQVINMLTAFFNLTTDIYTAVAGFNHYAHQKSFVGGITLAGNSIIRLCDADKKKIGGGVRVKKLELDDNWDNDFSTTPKNNTVYGQEYDYTTKDENGDVISSGVAYEPKIGGEESSLKTAVNYVNSTLFGSDYHMFVETPIGESYYPGASVGYSKVTVNSVGPNTSYQDFKSVSGNTGFHSTEFSAAPVNVYEFYTPKDFPVIFKNPTDKGPYAKPMKITIPILGLFTTTKVRHAQTQGYSIILNDMPGKPKITASYTAKVTQGVDECNNPKAIVKPDLLISKQEYVYNTVKPFNSNAVNELDSRVQTISVDNSTYNLKFQTAIMGQSHDFFIDMNENDQQHQAFGLKGSLDFQTLYPPLPPAFTWWALPSYEITKNNMRTVVANKIIYRTGILNKTINTIQQSVVTTENLAYDVETGQAILTKTNNEFNDPTYSFNYKGHWYYKNLGGSYQNYGVKINYSSFVPTILVLDNLKRVAVPSSYFTKGDLVYIDDGTTGTGATSGIYHVYSILSSGGVDHLSCINKDGYYYSGLSTGAHINSIEVVKSGYKNLQHADVGSLVFKNTKGSTNDFTAFNPSSPTTSPVGIEFADHTKNNILNASAVEFSDNWQTYGGYMKTITSPGPVCNFTPEGLAFVNFLNAISPSVSTSTYPQNILLYDYISGNYSNGFSAALILPSYNHTYSLYLNASVSGGVTTWTIGAHLPSGISPMCSFTSTGPFPPNIPTTFTTCGNILCSHPNDFSVIGNTCPGFPTQYSCPMFNGDGTPVERGSDPGDTTNSTESCTPYTIDIHCPCYNIFTSSVVTTTITCGPQINTPVNPYQIGMKGLWRAKYSYAYHSARNQNDDIRKDGTFDDFQRFPWENPVARNQKWVKANTISKVLPHGFEIENVDPIGVFSSALYGYNFTLPVAVSKNARYNEIAFDGFEDYPLNCIEDHFKFLDYFNVNPAYRTNAFAHTGKYSLIVNPNASPAALVEKDVKTQSDYDFYDLCTVKGNSFVDDDPTHIRPTYTSKDVAHLLVDNDFVGKFAPIEGKKYVISAWVHQDPIITNTNLLTTFSDASVSVNYVGCTGCSVSFSPSGNIIDGWQRIYGEFTIPVGVTKIDVSLNNVPTYNKTAYFDDIRIHPFDSNIETYVYDPITLKPVADLDANNYATFYNYDDEGHLIKVKIETKEGIKTVKEGRINTVKTP